MAITLDAGKQLQTDFAFGGLWGGERECPGGAVEGEQAVQPEAPEETAVAGAPAVIGGIGELAATGRLDATGALDWGRVDQHEIVVVAGAVAGELPDQRLDRLRQTLASLVVPGAARQFGKQMRETLTRRVDEPRVGGDPHERLRHTERDDFRVGHSATSVPLASREEIVSTAINRDQQQVEVGEHRGPLGSTARKGTADFDLTAVGPYKAVELLIY